MHGNYYDWIVSTTHPLGYCTAIHSDFRGFPVKTETENIEMTVEQAKDFKFDFKEDFVISVTLKPDTVKYRGCLLQLGKLGYYLNANTMKPEVRYQRKVYTSTNMLGTTDTWAIMPRGTNGKWYVPQKYSELRLKLEYKNGILRTYVNGLLDQTIELLPFVR